MGAAVLGFVCRCSTRQFCVIQAIGVYKTVCEATCRNASVWVSHLKRAMTCYNTKWEHSTAEGYPAYVELFSRCF